VGEADKVNMIIFEYVLLKKLSKEL